MTFGIRIPRMIDISPISLSIEDNQGRIEKKIESLVWDKETRRELSEGSIEFTGNPVPKDYWKNFKSNPKKALEIIGGEGFEVRKNPDNRQWEITKRFIETEEEEPKKETEPEKEKVSSSSKPEPVKNEIVEDINYPEDIDYPEDKWPKENTSP